MRPPLFTRRAFGKLLAFGLSTPAFGQAARIASSPLVLAGGGRPAAPIRTGRQAGPWETRAAQDLARYIGMMVGGAPPPILPSPGEGPAILLGEAALEAEPSLRRVLRRVAKPSPLVRADAIVVRRSGSRLLVAGSNDESHYFAASWLLQHWGCRWYMPTEFGEHVPRRDRLEVGALDHVHAPPFEIRHYWTAWNGDATGAEDFQRRNFMSSATVPGAGHALDRYTAGLVPPGGSHFDISFADPATAAHVAGQVAADYAAGRGISLAIADGAYSVRDPRDAALVTEYDRAFLRPSLTDAMLTLYNNVARGLRALHPRSRALIGGLAYSNVTLPPRRVRALEPNIVIWLAPIDVDPNHAIDDPRSPQRRRYGEMVRQWAAVTRGRLVIYDYDQAMLVWRDLPNPSHDVFARDVKAYRAAGILGIGTESRGAFATTFLNLFFRGQLMWNPDADVGALLGRFYDDFYGPAAAPMRRYWTRLFRAWEETAVTEHEHVVIPAIYTPELAGELEPDLAEAEIMAARAPADPMLARRLRFTRVSFELIKAYSEMTVLAATQSDYPGAAAAGERALAARLRLAQLHPMFTTRVVGSAAETEATGPAWLPGEVAQYRRLAALQAGPAGRLIRPLPLRWAFRVSEPLPESWTYQGPEGASGAWDTSFAQPDADIAQWREASTDNYLQAQGIIGPALDGALGHYWYRTELALQPGETGATVRLLFPGLFNETWLYVNGGLAAHRDYREPWWQTDYRFEWDVAVGPLLRPGRNVIALRGFNPHHMGGMFRRPFLYRPS